MNKRLYLLFACLLFASCLCLAQDLLSTDSTYRRVILVGRDSLDCRLAYPSGSSRVQSDYAYNGMELAKLDAFIRRAFSDTLFSVRSVQLTGYCSIDGTYAVNESLAKSRANGMKQYLDACYGLSSRCFVTLDYVGEDWTLLGKLIVASHYPWKAEALAIIDGVGVFEGREGVLMKLDGGMPYRTMKEMLFPQLRRVEVKVEYDLKRMMEQRYKRKLSEEEFQQVLEKERQVVKETPEEVVREVKQEARREELASYHPVIGIQINLMAWAGITPELERTTWMPNLAAEVFFGRCWSAEVSGTYANFAYGDKQHWAVSGYRVEPRFWLKRDRQFRGFYVGLFGQGGDFNVQTTEGNHTGRYLQGGVSVGYYLRVLKHFGFQFGLRGGYQQADLKSYDIEGSYYYPNGDTPSGNRFGLMGVHVGINYRY